MDSKTKNIDSKQILKTIYEQEILSRSYRIIKIDSTIIVEEPKLTPYINFIHTTLSRI